MVELDSNGDRFSRSQNLPLVRFLLSDICNPVKNMGFRGNKPLSWASLRYGVRMKLCSLRRFLSCNLVAHLPCVLYGGWNFLIQSPSTEAALSSLSV